MPKEYVTSAFDLREAVDINGASIVGAPAPFRVRVGWNRECGDVQIATVDEADGNDGSGFFVDLDRHGINSLIRILRRARDAAFGRDE
jgi:hypothetical protein